MPVEKHINHLIFPLHLKQKKNIWSNKIPSWGRHGVAALEEVNNFHFLALVVRQNAAFTSNRLYLGLAIRGEWNVS